ncbi:CBS domain protein [Haloactinopolyspora alba]|uniref:CBS domain protein n=1 Tax=Haloactinopolyspora alba TaxID=648780 RepID=A0A2P8E940_9ACTN|nr:CBS domain-containing protein [Haloactinopolyspora alba]PSL05917.1 CBS domain protein [Haloactinopolyspora alba]
MTVARDVMTVGAECVQTDQTAGEAARMMATQGVGALPICGKDRRIKGVVTDRDIVIKVVAQGRDAWNFPAGDLNQDEAVTAGADDSVDEVVTTMTEHGVKRLPVIDDDRLVGIIALSDLAHTLHSDQLTGLVTALSSDGAQRSGSRS